MIDKKMKKQFDKVIIHSQNIPDPKTEKLFEMWELNKSKFIDLMGGKLIYEMPEKMSFELSEQSKKERIQHFINLCYNEGYNELSDFVEAEQDGFFKNICNYNYKEVTKGTKLIKAFKFFVNNPEKLNYFQSKASQIIQENKIEGKLCFSVHPLDYLSISENTLNWRSCHALDGEYRAGNLSYMMDNTTVVCYLKTEDDVKLPHFPEDVLWNNKKWRMLLYISADNKMIFAGRQYPFSSEQIMDTVLECFNKQSEDSWNPWSDKTINKMKVHQAEFVFDNNYIPVGDSLIPINELVHNVEGSKHYNDVLYSSYYDPQYTFVALPSWWNNSLEPKTSIKRTKFNIGEFTYCLYCGKEEVLDQGSSTMMCYDCEKKYGNSINEMFCFCDRCGERQETDDCYWVQDEYYCPDCFKEYCQQCDICGEYYLKENMRYDETNDTYYCRWCI